MKTSSKITFLIACPFFFLPQIFSASCLEGQEKKEDLQTLKQKASYLVGFDIGEDVLRRELDVDYDLLIRGFLDAVNKKKPPLTKTEMESVMKAFEKQVNDRADAKWKALARTNMEAGTEFLAKNKLNKGVVQTESGLQFKVVTEGEGEKPKLGSSIKLHVVGKHVDRSEFENTYKTKQPVTVTVGTTIRGLDEAVQRMRAGEKWEIFIPANLGFGQRGSPPAVGPNETLIYEVELLEIVKK